MQYCERIWPYKNSQKNYPVRPIISAVNTSTYAISKFFATFLYKVLKRPASHVDNSWELKQKIDHMTIPPGYEIISLDVISLFSNVVDYLIFNALEKRWQYLFNSINISCNEYIDTIRFIVDNNYFQFNNNYYKQIFSAAMGNPLSPILSDIVMEDLEQHALSKICFPVPFIYRYVDDIIMCVPSHMIDYTVSLFNSFDNNLQFTVEKSMNNKISFLDICIMNENNNFLAINWYRKPTFSGRLLNFYSHHPINNKIGIGCSLVDRSIKFSDERFHEENLNFIKIYF